MYGTIMRARIKKGEKDDFVALLRRQVPTAEDYGQGLHSFELAWEDADPDRVLIVVHFRDKQSYLANANRAETDEQFREQQKHFDGDAEWIDLNFAEYVGKPLTEAVSSQA